MALLKEFRYETAQDVQSRIGKSIIRYKNKPVWAELTQDPDRNGGNNLAVDLVDIHSGERWDNVHSSDEDIDVRAFPLGYFNSKNGASYITRMPVRRNKQGLSTENCCSWYTDAHGNRRSSPMDRLSVISKPFFAMLNQQYPPLQAVLKTIADSKKSIESMAFAPKFAIQEDAIGLLKLQYMGMPVAVFAKKKEIFMLSERLAHYEPVLRKLGIPVEINE